MGAGPSRKRAGATVPDCAAGLFAQAKHCARLIIDESSKASALASVANEMTATDPSRAAQLLAEAGRITDFITNESSKAWALSGIAKAVAATDPDRAEHLATSITNEAAQAGCWSASRRR